MKNQIQCDKCVASFKSEHGLKIHNARMHTARGKKWKKATTKSNKNRFTSSLEEPKQSLAFCPCCGLDLRKVSVAINL